MPTLNRTQLNKILELMLKNQASDPRSMVVVNGGSGFVLGDTEAKSLASVVDGTLTDRLDLGKANERQELQTPETLPKTIIVDGEGKAKIESLEDHVKAALMKDVKDSFLARVMSKDVFNLTVAEAQKVQMIYDLDSRNMIAISPTGAIEALDISEVMDDVNQKVDKMIADANQEDADYIAAQAKLIEEEDRLRRELITFKELSQREMQTIGEQYNEEIKKVYEEEKGQKDIIDPERAAGLNAELEELQRKNIEDIKKEIEEAQGNYEREVKSKQAELSENIKALGESPKAGEALNLRKEMNAEIGTLTTLHNGKMDLLRSSLRDQEFNMQVKVVTDRKARVHVARTEGAKLPAVERAEETLKELEQRRKQIGEEIAAKSEEIQKAIVQKEEAREKAVTELKEKMTSEQKNAFESRKEKLKGSYLPSWLGGKTGLENEIKSTMADQSKAMETAQLVSVDVSSDPDQEGIELQTPVQIANKKRTEILAEKMRLRGLRASIEESLIEKSSEYDLPFVEDIADMREWDDNSSVISDTSTTSEPDPEMVFKILKRAFTYNYQSLEEYKTIREVREEVVRAEELTKKSREQIDIFKKQLEFLNQLKSHAENSVTGVTGLDIVKQKLEKSLLNSQEQSDIRDMLEGKARQPGLSNLRAYAAVQAQRSFSRLTGEGGAASVDMLDTDTLRRIIEGIENQINELEKTIKESEENVSEANKRALDPTHGGQAKDVAAKVESMQKKVNAYESLLTERGVSKEEINELKTAVYKSDDDSMKDRIMTNSLFSPEALRDEFAKITEGSSISSQSSAGLEDDSYDGFDSEREYATDEERLPIDIIMAGLEVIMAGLEANAEQSLLARKKLALLAQLEVMSPATLNTAGKLTISHEYLEKLEKLERLYSGPTLTAESLKEHDREVSSQSSFGSSSDSDNSSVISAASTETSMDEKVDATLDERDSAPTPQDLVARYNLCFRNLQQEIAKDAYLGAALTGEIGGELVADNLQTVAKQASAITEAEVAQASISRDDAQKITDAAMAELLEEASNVGINLTALTENNGDNRLFNKLKDATITEFRCDEFGSCIPVKDEEGNEVKDAFGFPQYETEEVRIFPEGVVGLVKKGELDFLSFLSLDRRSWSNVTTKALNAAIDLLNGLIKMVNFVLSEQLKLGEWIKYTLPYQEITAAQLADVFLIKGDSQEKLINKGVDLSVFAMLHKKAIVLSTMQDALAITTDKDFVTRFSHAVRKNFAETANPQMIEQARKTMQKELLFGKGTGKDRYKGLKESVSAYAFNSLIAKQYRVYRAIVSQMTANQEENQAVIRRQLGNLNNTEDLVRTILQAVPLDGNTSLNDEFKIGPDANAMEIIEAARGLVESRKTAEGSIGNMNAASEKVMEQLDYVEKIKESMHTLDHSDVEAEIMVAVKRMTATLEAMEKITNESTEADCLQKIEAALPGIEESLEKKLNALPEPVRKALAGKSIDARVEERFGAMWFVFPLKWFTTKDKIRDKVIQEVLATANAGTVDGVTYTEEHIKQVEEVLQLQSMQQDLIGIQREIMRNNDLMHASTKASVENKDLHKEVKALYTQALEAFPGADFDPSKLEAEYKGKKMTVNKVDKDAKYISMPTRMIPVFVKALQEANLDKDYKAAQQAFTEAESAVASQKQTITGLEEKRTEAQKALTAAQQEYDNFSGEKEMPIQEDLDAPLLQNDAQNPQPTPKWQAVKDRLEAAQKAVKAAVEHVDSEKTKLTALVGVAKKAETKLDDDDFDKVKIETYQKALTAMSTGLDSRTQAAVEGFKQHKERKDTITTRVKKAGDLMEKLQSSQQPSTPSVSRSNSSDDPEQGLDSNNPNGPGK